MRKILLLALPCLFLSSCLTHLVPRSKEKTASLHRNLEDWKAPNSVINFGRSRSHQVFETVDLTFKDNTMNYSGGMGMLAVISRDGYALTAAHVINRRREGSIIASSSTNLRLQLSELSLKIEGKDPVKIGPYLQAYPVKEFGLQGIDSKTITTKKARLVHQFHGRDLVLVKLPIVGENFFSLGEQPMKGDLVFSSGNPRASQPGPSSGRITTGTNRNFIHASIPLAPGDSGGPIMNAEGTLIGISSQARFGNLSSFRFINHAGIELINRREVMNLIADDRSKKPTINRPKN